MAFSGSVTPYTNQAAQDLDSLDDDLSSLSDFNDDDNSLDEYFEDDLIPQNDANTSVLSSVLDSTDEVVVIPSCTEGNYTEEDYSWRTGYTVNLKSYGNLNNSNNVTENSPSYIARNLYSSSESNISRSGSVKKKLSVDLNDTSDSVNGLSLFRSIGNWFRGSGRSKKPVGHAASNNNTEKVVSTVALPPKQNPPPLNCTEVGTSFSREHSSLRNSQRRKIHLSFTDKEDKSSEDEEESSSTESFSSKVNISNSPFSTALQSPKTFSQTLEVSYELRSPDNQQYICWQRQFRKCPGVTIVKKSIDHSLVADALIIPGNSFGFLDGEPELHYIRIFGWEIQRRLRQIICQLHDGELLIGEAVILPLNKLEGDSDSHSDQSEEDNSNSETLTENDDDKRKQPLRTISVDFEENGSVRNHCKTVKNIVYVPVMRVPIHVSDTVNAYLAFRAAIRAVKSHNQNCDEAKKIATVVCPPLCDDIGRMPSGRISLQMRTAYDAFVLNKRHDVRSPIDLGSLATNHVELTTAKNGNWC